MQRPTPRLDAAPRRFALAAAACALAVPVALAGSLPAGLARPERSLREAASTEPLHPAVAATFAAQKNVGVEAWEGGKTVVGILGRDLASFWRLAQRRLTFSARLGDNPFFVAHKEAAIVGPRAGEPWDLYWALPEELKAPGAWRAAVANLPPASVRGTRAAPEHGITFTSWPPVVVGD